jgi:rSAM/selenodomain-associated transferase 2
MISVVIPTYNEQAHIKATIQSLWQHDNAQLIKQIIVVDSGSSDATLKVATPEGVQIVISPKKGRAAQMNYGTTIATENILYFLHAASIPPPHFSSDILQAVRKGCIAGCFMLAFDHKPWFLKANCWFTRFDVNAFHYGDQSLFVQRSHFEKVGGFSEKHIIFEDYHIIRELKKIGAFHIIKKPVITSARKYL